MLQLREAVVRSIPIAAVRADRRAEAVEFLRGQLSEDVQDQFREVIHAGSLDVLDSVVGRFVQQMLRGAGFGERELGVDRLESAWQGLVRDAVR